MRESYWGYWIILLGVFVIVIMMLVSNVTTTNTQDYYIIKEVTEQSMVDAVDLAYYRTSGELKINADKFVESFLRRFSSDVNNNKSYQITIQEVIEYPPKVSVRIDTYNSYNNKIETSQEFQTGDFKIRNQIDAIFEEKN